MTRLGGYGDMRQSGRIGSHETRVADRSRCGVRRYPGDWAVSRTGGRRELFGLGGVDRGTRLVERDGHVGRRRCRHGDGALGRTGCRGSGDDGRTGSHRCDGDRQGPVDLTARSASGRCDGSHAVIAVSPVDGLSCGLCGGGQRLCATVEGHGQARAETQGHGGVDGQVAWQPALAVDHVAVVPRRNVGIELHGVHAQVELDSVLLAAVESAGGTAEEDVLGDLVLDAHAVGRTVADIGREVGIGGLHIVDDGDGHLLTRRDDVDALVEIIGVEEVHRRVGDTGRRRAVLDDGIVETRRDLVGGLGIRRTLTAVAATVLHGDTLAEGQVGGPGIVEPQGLVGHGVVQVERTFQGDARERDRAHVDLRTVGDVAAGIVGQPVGVGIDLDVELREGMLEGEGHLLAGTRRVLHVEPGQTRGHRL